MPHHCIIEERISRYYCLHASNTHVTVQPSCRARWTGAAPPPPRYLEKGEGVHFPIYGVPV